MKELDRILKHLKLKEPEIENRESLREEIMHRISNKSKRLDYLFGWTEIVWLRRSLATASAVIVILFILQQLHVVNRIDQLEKRVLSFNTEKILEYQREDVIVNSVLMSSEEMTLLTDSINVSKYDLLNLIREYRDLQAKYEQIVGSKINERSIPNKQKL